MRNMEVSGFWDGFLQEVLKAGVPERNAKFYVNWAHKFALYFRNVPLRDRSIDDINSFLKSVESQPYILPWRAKQARDALRILYRQYLQMDPAKMPKIRTETGRFRDRDTIRDFGVFRSACGAVMQKVSCEIRRRNYSMRTHEAYVSWISRFLWFHGLKKPELIPSEGIRDYLNYLALDKEVAPSTQNQALNAIVFLYKQVLRKEAGNFSGFANAKVTLRKPEVLSREEVGRLLKVLKEPYALMAGLLYGSGLRLMECLGLRVRDVDFDQKLIMVRQGKGGKDRETMLAVRLVVPLKKQIQHAKGLYERDRLHDPGLKWMDYFVFPSDYLVADPKTRRVTRGSISRVQLYREIRDAGRRAEITKRLSPHVLRHAFASHLLANGENIRVVQELLGHKDVTTTMIYTHPMNQAGDKVVSPADE